MSRRRIEAKKVPESTFRVTLFRYALDEPADAIELVPAVLAGIGQFGDEQRGLALAARIGRLGLSGARQEARRRDHGHPLDPDHDRRFADGFAGRQEQPA